MKRLKLAIAVGFLAVLFILSPQPSFSYTSVTFDDGGILTNISGIQFTIISPTNISAATDFVASLPSGWTNFSLNLNFYGIGDNINFLKPGLVGAFTNVPSHVELGAWALADSEFNSLVLNTDFFVTYNNQTDTYNVSAVPIPAAAWLLGSGLVGLVALKRRKKA